MKVTCGHGEIVVDINHMLMYG